MKYQQRFITQKIRNEFAGKYTPKNDGCWEWNLYKDRDGYGQVHLKYDDGKHNICRAHRISWMIANQQDWPIDKPVARHICNNPHCVNPDHVIPGTHQENTDDMIKAGRYVHHTWKKEKSHV